MCAALAEAAARASRLRHVGPERAPVFAGSSFIGPWTISIMPGGIVLVGSSGGVERSFASVGPGTIAAGADDALLASGFSGRDAC
jgi:hypothetical protein